jgi:cellulose synthase/poly-beta-1,6-N-acetylglucosamine synthase-like glycosyltransferase
VIGHSAFLAPSLGVGFAAFHIAFFRWLWRGLHTQAKLHPVTQDVVVTILVAARNEADNLQRLLPALLSQKCDRICPQIVVIDDRSTDGTPQILSAFAERIEVVRVDELPTGRAPKKHALTQGLARAKGEFVLQIDADNLPGPMWASTMVSYFGPRTGAVCGLVFHSAKSHGGPGLVSWDLGLGSHRLGCCPGVRHRRGNADLGQRGKSRLSSEGIRLGPRIFRSSGGGFRR